MKTTDNVLGEPGRISCAEVVEVRDVSVRTWPAVPGSVERGWVGRSMSGHWLACGDLVWIVGLEGRPVAAKEPELVGNSTLILRQWTMFVMPSLPMACASVAAGRWWT